MSFFTHLECSVPGGAAASTRTSNQHLCTWRPLLARYNLDAARLAARLAGGARADMWRYRELMPLLDGSAVTLGEGWTPLIHTKRLGDALGMSTSYVKDESLNPTNSFKARGLSAAVTRAAHLGARRSRSLGWQCGQRRCRIRRRGSRSSTSSCLTT